MSASSRRKSNAQSSPESPLFTLGTHPVKPVTRAWERTASSPRKRQQRKGTKVWRRAAVQDKDALVSAQLLSDLEASLSVHVSKRQRTNQLPTVPYVAQQQVQYAPTVADVGTPGLKRKIATRRRSTRSPVKRVIEDGWLSPTKKTARRRSSIKPAQQSQSRDDTESTVPNPQEVSFLDAINIRGSTIFDTEVSDKEREGVQDSEDEASLSGSDGADNANELQVAADDETSDEPEEDDETGRLVDAGNTGVVNLEPVEDDSDLEDLLGTQTLTEDFNDTAVQDYVIELLQTPPNELQAAFDEILATPSASTGEERLKISLDESTDNGSPFPPTLIREDTDSTVAFDDLDVTGLVFGSFSPSRLRVEKQTPMHEFESPAGKDDQNESQETDKEVYESDDLKAGQEEKAEGEDEDEDEEESADELFAGSPTLKRIFLSPVKTTSPTKLSPKKTRSGPRLSDDTTYLNDFLSRVRSQAAARSQEKVSSPVKIATPQKPSRQVLGELDVNSPTPSPVSGASVSSDKEKRRDGSRNQKSTGSPVKVPKTPIARALLSSNLDSPDTPDELTEAPALPPPGQNSDGPAARRAGRSRLAAPSRLPLNAPSNIPFRRADGDPPILQRNEAQKLARTTAANTRRNKGGARFPKHVVESFEGRQLSPVKDKGIVKNRKGQNVDWDHRLVYFLEDAGTEVEIDDEGKLVEKENGKEVKKKVRIVKGERVMDDDALETTAREDVNLTSLPEPQLQPQLQPEPEPTTEREPAPSVEPKASKIAKAPRKVRVATPRPSKVELPTALKADKTGSSAAVPSSKLKADTKKPGRIVNRPTTSLGTQGTPAAKRMLSVESTMTSIPAAKRRIRKP